MEDCVHIKACRRLSKIAKNKGFIFSRGCNENCTAYKSGEGKRYVTVEIATDFARCGAESIRQGYYELDVWCPWDLDNVSKDLKDLVYEEDDEK